MSVHKVPVIWRNPDGKPIGEYAPAAAPFIDMHFAVEGTKRSRMCRALIDTGSSYTMLDMRLINELSPRFVGFKLISGNLSTEPVAFYRINLVADQFRAMVVVAEVGALNAETDLGALHAVIGLDFLTFGTLVLRSPPADSYFCIDEAALALRCQTAQQAQQRS